jgi:predicted  nucleic acid-binding Zn-ribbon protein
MVLVSAVVVFVNRTEDFRRLNTEATAKLAAAKNDTALANSELASVKAAMQQQLNAKDAALTAQRQTLDADQTTIGGLNQQIAQLTSNLAMANSAQTTTTAALQVAQTQNATLETNYAALRREQDALQAQYTESSLHITDLQNKLDVTEKQRRYLAEQVTQLTSENAQQADIIQKNMPAIEERQGQILNPTPTIALDGVVRDKTVIAGVPYATISIGSADQVQKNMQFKVIDHDKFLGYLTVDTVEPHEATGRLDGPHIEDIHSGVEVKTQL